MSEKQYSKMYLIYFVLMTSSIFIFLSVCPVAAFEYKDEAFNYELQIPDGWVKLDQNVINNANKVPSSGSTTVPHFAIGFVKGDSSQKIYPAYMLIEHNITSTTFEKLAEQFHGKSINFDQKLPDNFSEPIIDKHNKFIILPSTQKFQSIGTVNAITALTVGRSGVVQIYLYSLEQEYPANFPVFTSIIQSFSFQENYGAIEPDISEGPSAMSVLSNTLLGAGLGIGIFWLIKRRKKVS